MKTMTYKGYTAEIVYSDEDECFVGHLVNIDDIVGFHGDTDEELRDAFENMVELYIETLAEPENPTQKHFAGKLGKINIPPTSSTSSVKVERLFR